MERAAALAGDETAYTSFTPTVAGQQWSNTHSHPGVSMEEAGLILP